MGENLKSESEEQVTERVLIWPETVREGAGEVLGGGDVGSGGLGVVRVLKRRGRRPGLTLSERDLAVLEWVAENRWSTAELVIEAFYQDAKKLRPGLAFSGQYARRRLTRLESEGYLRPSQYRVGSLVPLLVSNKGYDLLHGFGRVTWAHPFSDVAIAQYEHEVWIQKLRILFEKKHGATDWRSERRLRQAHAEKALAYVPDARFHAGGFSWALEVERTQKANARIKELLGIREKTNKNSKMIYVMPRSLVETFRNIITKNLMMFEQGLYIVTFEDLGTAYCSRQAWHPMKVSDLLAGRPEPDLLASKPKPKEQVAKPVAAPRASVLDYYETIRKYFDESTKMLSDVRTALVNNQGRLGGLLGPKNHIHLEYPNFPKSVGAFQKLVGQLESQRSRSAIGEAEAKIKSILDPFDRDFSYWVNSFRSAQNGGETWPMPPEKLESAEAMQKLLSWMEKKIAERKTV